MGRISLAGTRGLFLLLAVSGAGACSGPPEHSVRFEPVGHSASAATVCAASTVVKGVDVSSYQGTVDWASVKKSGIDFAIARISDGGYLDGEFSSNWSGMKSAGLVRGAYQYFEPADDPTTDGNIVVTAVGKLGKGDLPVTADMETTGGQSAATIVAHLKTWASVVEAGTGKKPMIYTAVGFWDGSVSSSAFSSNPLWVANWGVSCPDLPSEWSGWDIWQYSDSGSVSGISGAVDLDEFNGDLASLESFAGGTAPPPMDGGSDGGMTTGYYAAKYVSQSWPLATTTMMMTTCQTIAASITFMNVGTSTWNSNTRLATTVARDRTSDFADSTWVSKNRLAEVSGTVPPGGTYEFKFDFHAPPTTGSYDEHYGLVQDGVAWFGDPGQGGPPDTDIEAKIDVTMGTATCTVDPGVPDGGTAMPDSGKNPDGGLPPPPPDGGGHGRDSGRPLFDEASVPPESGNGATPGGGFDNHGNGCACGVAETEHGGAEGAPWAIGLLGLAGFARKRRRGARPYDR